ncbi:MAG: hypothetical protein JEY79_07095 [Pseudodesulfovibrio sp.]|nr:hypothetical protein [Pseudodesulfovibrio sp.]
MVQVELPKDRNLTELYLLVNVCHLSIPAGWIYQRTPGMRLLHRIILIIVSSGIALTGQDFEYDRKERWSGVRAVLGVVIWT